MLLLALKNSVCISFLKKSIESVLLLTLKNRRFTSFLYQLKILTLIFSAKRSVSFFWV